MKINKGNKRTPRARVPGRPNPAGTKLAKAVWRATQSMKWQNPAGKSTERSDAVHSNTGLFQSAPSTSAECSEDPQVQS